MDIKHLNNIEETIRNSVADKKVAGVNVLVVKDGKEMGYFQAGFADIEKNQRFNRDTIVRLYSQSKPVTAVAAWILIEKGKMELHDEVGKFIPEFWNLKVCINKNDVKPVSRHLTIQDLLNMTSGYGYGAWSEDSLSGEKETTKLLNELNADVLGENKITTKEVAKRLAGIPVNFEPGTDYNYGLSADILGAVIEVVSGMKFSDFLKKNIFEPLGMKDTDFYVPEEKLPRLASVYKVVQDKDFKNHLELFTNPNLGIQPLMDHAPAFESGGAGLCSTLDDYLKFAQMLLNGGILDGHRILQEKTVEYLSSARLRPDLQQKFDMRMPHLAGYTYCNLLRVAIEPGFCNVLTEKGEFGWDGWLGPFVSIDRKNKLIVLMAMQKCDAGTWELTRKVRNIIYSSL